MKLHFRKYGEGAPFMILHGLFGMSDNWQTVGKKLSEKYTVYLVDLRNHGHSPHSIEWNYELMAADVKELLDDEGISKTILMGHSMGGKTAMTFADHFCEALEKIIVVDIAMRRYSPPTDVLNAIGAVHLDTISTRKEAEEIIAFYLDDPGTRQFLLKNLYWESDDKLAWRFNIDTISKQVGNIAQEISIKNTCHAPALFLHGARSRYVIEDDKNELRKKFPSAVFSEIEDAGHWVHAKNPSGFMRALESFLL